MSVALTIKHLKKKFEGADNFVLNDISIDVLESEIIALTGESGCGKTTLLRTIAGFEDIQEGVISISGNEITSKKHKTKPELRNVGMVFQDLALFPHMNVSKNIAYGINKLNKAVQSERIAEVINLTNLNGLENRYPHELSGGQKQRVALARALVAKPKILLMDEPFSNLDEILKVKVRHEIKSILKKSGMTTIMVTHDSQDAFSLADRIAIMKNGELIQIDAPKTLFDQPKNPYVARFFGEISMLSGTKCEQGIATKFGVIPISTHYDISKIGIRPNAMLINMKEKGFLSGKIADIQYLGEYFDYQITSKDKTEHIHIRSIDQIYNIGDHISFSVTRNQIKIFPAN